MPRCRQQVTELLTLHTRQRLHYTGKTGKVVKRNPCQQRYREFENFAKAQGILFAQVVNSLILNIQDIARIAPKSLNFSKS